MLAGRVGGRAVAFEDLAAELPEVDVVVSSTGSGEWVVRGETVAGALELREDPLFFVDIAVPRDVDPVVQTLTSVYLYDIDDLQAVVERNAEGRAGRRGRGGGYDLARPSWSSWAGSRRCTSSRLSRSCGTGPSGYGATSSRAP